MAKWTLAQTGCTGSVDEHPVRGLLSSYFRVKNEAQNQPSSKASNSSLTLELNGDNLELSF